ncbi:putative c2h2 and c2hc zinc finger [Erysiphe neolycopersici]|uniref:Putative c2h2 and c2hc zinc finger n=1 Tax=Erysiphe neolycopersici TaxID=212602 RepID=A0A420HH90_9PEZI|nr:putative c2h2 and c2hc zinc finger [Erysiphe neolycopersici]
MSSVGRSDVSGHLNHSIPSPCINQQFHHDSVQPRIDHTERNQPFQDPARLNTSSIAGANLSSNENLNCPANTTISLTNASADIENLQLQKEVHQLRAVLSQTSVKATQLVLGHQWRDLQFNDLDENSMSSVCQNVLKNVDISVLRKAFQNESLFESSICDFLCQKKQIITRVLKSVTCDQLSSLVPESTLNKTLAERIKYVPARDLINWLASADRLGYKPDDILDDDELVTPNKTSQDLYETRQDKNSVENNSVVNNQIIKPSPELVKDTISGAIQVVTTNTTQAQNLNPTESYGQDIATNSQISSSGQNKEQFMKMFATIRSNQAEQHRLASAGPLNTPSVAIPHSSHIPNGSNTWLSGTDAQHPTFQPSELVKVLDGTSNQNSNVNSQYNIPSIYSPQTFGNNLSSSRRSSALNISHTSEHVSPQFDQSTQMKSLNTSSHTTYSPPLHPPSRAVALLQNEVKAVDEMLKKEVANIPAGISQDQRLAKIKSLVYLASAQKYKLGISHGLHVDMQKISYMTHEALRLDSSLQEAHPAIVYGSSNNYPRANPNSTGSNRSSPVLENGNSLSNCVVTDRNPFSLQIAANTRHFPPVYSTPYPNVESHENFKRPRCESSVINPRPVGPNQSFNNGPSNLNINTGVNTNSYLMNANYQSLQVESQPVTSGPIIQNTDSVNLVANHSPVSISATSELSGSKDI